MADLPADAPSYLQQLRNKLGDDHGVASLLQGKPRPSETTYGPFGEKYDVEYVTPPDASALLGMRFGFRGMPQARFPGPWAAERPPAQGPVREWKQPGDDSIGQNVYEALLGRTREAGEAVAKPGSGWWNVGGQPIPKPTNVLPWAGAAGVGYGIWNGLGGPELMERWKKDGPDLGGLAKDIVTGRIAQKFRDDSAADAARVPYPPDPSKP